MWGSEKKSPQIAGAFPMKANSCPQKQRENLVEWFITANFPTKVQPQVVTYTSSTDESSNFQLKDISSIWIMGWGGYIKTACMCMYVWDPKKARPKRVKVLILVVILFDESWWSFGAKKHKCFFWFTNLQLNPNFQKILYTFLSKCTWLLRELELKWS